MTTPSGFGRRASAPGPTQAWSWRRSEGSAQPRPRRALATPDPPPGPLARWLPEWPHSDPHPGPSRAHLALVVICGGVLLICLAYALGRRGQPGAAALFWAGQGAIVVPYVVRVLAPRTPFGERALLLGGVSALQSFLTWAYSPDQFRFPDELQHLRTLNDILRTDHLFTPNSYLAVSPGFPGMEVATAAVHDLTGLSGFYAALVVVSICHAILPVLVLGMVKELTGSVRTAAVAGLVYGTALHHPHYNALFVYGAVALPFMVLAVWAAVRYRRPGMRVLAILPPAVVTTMTHHLTTAAMVGLLLGCVAVMSLAQAERRKVVTLAVVTVAVAAGAVGWTATTAPDTFGYLGGPLRTIVAALRSSGSGKPEAPMSSSPPLWESLMSMASAGITLGLVGLGVIAVWRSAAPRYVRWFSALGGVYVLVLAVRLLAPGGAELATRALSYAMVLVALPAAAGLVWLWQSGTARWRGVAAILAASVMMAGTVTAGLPPWWERIPGRFWIGGYESGVDRAVELSGRWAERATPPGARAACDLSICSVVASYGRATVSTTASSVYYGTAEELPQRLATLSLDYVYVDDRMSEQLPILGIYFFRDDQEGRHATALDPALLTKFETTPGMDLVYDNGHVHAYAAKRAWK